MKQSLLPCEVFRAWLLDAMPPSELQHPDATGERTVQRHFQSSCLQTHTWAPPPTICTAQPRPRPQRPWNSSQGLEDGTRALVRRIEAWAQLELPRARADGAHRTVLRRVWVWRWKQELWDGGSRFKKKALGFVVFGGVMELMLGHWYLAVTS